MQHALFYQQCYNVMQYALRGIPAAMQYIYIYIHLRDVTAKVGAGAGHMGVARLVLMHVCILMCTSFFRKRSLSAQILR